MADELTMDSGALIFATLADVYLSSGMIEEAISILKDGLSRNPTYTLAKIILGRAYYMKDDLHESIKVLEEARGEVPNSENANLYLGHCYRKLGEEGKAVEFYEKTLEINPDNKAAKQELQTMQRAEPALPSAETPPEPVTEEVVKQPEAVAFEKTDVTGSTEAPEDLQEAEEKSEPEPVPEPVPDKVAEPLQEEQPVSDEPAVSAEPVAEVQTPHEEETTAREEAAPAGDEPGAAAAAPVEQPPAESTRDIQEESPQPEADIEQPREEQAAVGGVEAVCVPIGPSEPVHEAEAAPEGAVIPFESLKEPVNKLLAMKAVKGAFICSPDGLLIQNYYPEYPDIEELCAMVAAIHNEANEAFRFLDEGMVDKFIIEKGVETVCVITAGESLLVVLTKAEAKPGLVFIYARKIIEEIREILG